MLRSTSVLLVAVIFGAVHGFGAMAYAQDVSAGADVQPPVALDPIVAEVPPEVAVDGTVGLRLLIDAEGHVQEVEVIEPLAPELDEAAREAALRARFIPARRGDTPVASRIVIRVEFQRPEDATTEPPAEAEADPAAEVEPAPPSPPPLPSLENDAPIEVLVEGPSRADQLRRSARAVTVIETEQAKRQSADLGEVLARTEGIGVRREGGLGSSTRFSLNGFTDDQIRFFLDGVPLHLAGYPFGIANVPVNLVERVEVYRGVVPIRFGADALGGAVNLVSHEDVRGTHGAASYQVGSFGTHRLTLDARHLHEPTGFFTRVGGFFDSADNDYPINVMIDSRRVETRGQQIPARVHRFHDGYRARGANLETGFVDRPWAKRLLLRTFYTDYDRELQHNIFMTRPYGDVEYGGRSTGATLRYENVFARRFPVDAIAGYTYGRTRFRDVGTCIYDWFGQCGRDRQRPGEIEEPRNDRLWEHATFGRFNFGWVISAGHELRVSLAPTHIARDGKELVRSSSNDYGAVSAERGLTSFVSGIEYETDLFDGRLENILFVKSYQQWARSTNAVAGSFVDRTLSRDTLSFGGGNSLRYRIEEWLFAKASYEYATRLPNADEVFGDGVLVRENLGLVPEVSHNANLGLTVDARKTRAGGIRAMVNGFYRDAENLIVSLSADGNRLRNENLFSARSVGIEASSGWTSPGEYVALDGNVTYQDFRNLLGTGLFEQFSGDRIPNRPYLFANGTARLQLRGVAAANDELALTWHTRYVHTFFQFWESAGTRESKLTIPSQFLHSLALTYLVQGDPIALSFTGEVQNLTDQPAFDFFGVQRPGRAFYFKTTAEF